MSAPIPPAFQSPLLNRRRFLGDTGLGLGSIALTHLLGRQGLLADNADRREPLRPLIEPGHPYGARQSHFPRVPRTCW